MPARVRRRCPTRRAPVRSMRPNDWCHSSSSGRCASFDPVSGMSLLTTRRISRASADQRRGRAGRLEAGVCYRAWSEGAHPSLAPFTPPEIVDADLAPLALELASWGVRDATALRWLDAPPAAQLARARPLPQ